MMNRWEAMETRRQYAPGRKISIDVVNTSYVFLRAVVSHGACKEFQGDGFVDLRTGLVELICRGGVDFDAVGERIPALNR